MNESNTHQFTQVNVFRLVQHIVSIISSFKSGKYDLLQQVVHLKPPDAFIVSFATPTSILLYSPGNEVISIVIWELWENGQYVELSALSVLFILLLLVLVGIAQMAGKRFGVKDS
ncbi:MAG: Trehalose transport system permease protein SugB [Pseudomonadota bacterium]